MSINPPTKPGCHPSGEPMDSVVKRVSEAAWPKANEMVERGARAICEFRGIDYDAVRRCETRFEPDWFDRQARAVIEALREPAQAMLREVGEMPESPTIGAEWRAMIDAALKP